MGECDNMGYELLVENGNWIWYRASDDTGLTRNLKIVSWSIVFCTQHSLGMRFESKEEATTAMMEYQKTEQS